jgi:hypothetical protein
VALGAFLGTVVQALIAWGLILHVVLSSASAFSVSPHRTCLRG